MFIFISVIFLVPQVKQFLILHFLFQLHFLFNLIVNTNIYFNLITINVDVKTIAFSFSYPCFSHLSSNMSPIYTHCPAVRAFSPPHSSKQKHANILKANVSKTKGPHLILKLLLRRSFTLVHSLLVYKGQSQPGVGQFCFSQQAPLSDISHII